MPAVFWSKYMKKHYAVIGHPIFHTMSPFIHNRLFALSNIDAEYNIIDISPDQLNSEYKKTLLNLDGYNITIPHKNAIIDHLDILSDRAKMYKSVNTVKNEEGIAFGHTTDPDGFLISAKKAGIRFSDRIVILGYGGVARTIAYEVALMGLDFEFAVREKSIKNAQKLTDEITNTVKGRNIYISDINELKGNISLLINATPVGMYPDINSVPVSNDVIKNSEQIYDVIYNPIETLLIKYGKKYGCKTLSGMDMLVYQAVAAHKMWDGSEYDDNDISKLCIDTAKELENR